MFVCVYRNTIGDVLYGVNCHQYFNNFSFTDRIIKHKCYHMSLECVIRDFEDSSYLKTLRRWKSFTTIPSIPSSFQTTGQSVFRITSANDCYEAHFFCPVPGKLFCCCLHLVLKVWQNLWSWIGMAASHLMVTNSIGFNIFVLMEFSTELSRKEVYLKWELAPIGYIR